MLPVQITVRSMEDPLAIEYHVFKRFKKIYSNHPKISSCRIVVDVVQKHKHKGKIYSISVDSVVSGREVACSKQNQNLYAGVRDAFCAMERILEKCSHRYDLHVDKFAMHHFYDEQFQESATLIEMG